MPSIGGITEIIGVRAVIIDVRQYLADGRQIEATNDRIAAASKKVEVASTSAANATKANFAAQKKAYADIQAASQARLRALQLEIQAEDARANLAAASRARPQGPNGQFISQAAAQDVKDQSEAVIKAQQDAIGLRALTARTAVQSSKEAAAASAVEITAINRENAALEQQAALRKQLSEAQRSRLNALTTGVGLVGTAAIGVTAGASIKAAADYQQELSKINVLTDATDQQTAQLGQTFLKLSTQIPVSAADLAQSAYLALSSGIKDTGEALTLTTQSAKAAVAAQTDIKDVIGAVISVLNAYPKGAIDASKANDILFAGVKVGRAEFNDFANSIGKLLPVAASLGVPFDQVTAALATMTNAGINAEEASTALRAILNDLIKDSSSKQAAAALSAIGLSADQLYESIKTKGLAATLQNLFELFGKNVAAIEPLIPNIRGMVGLLALAQNGGKGFADNLNSVDHALGIVDQSFDKTKGNVANLAKIVSNELNVALIEIGSAILPTVAANLQDLIKYIEANKDSIAKFISEGLQLLISTIKTFVEGIGVAIKGFGLLKEALSSIVGSAEADKAALALIGLGLAWALPGGPYLKGLALVITALGQISQSSQSGESTLKTIIRAAAPIVGGLATTGVVASVTGGFGATSTPLAFGAGATGANLLTNLILGSPKGGIKGKSDISDVTDLINKLNAPIKELGDSSLPSFDSGIKATDQAAKAAAENLKKLAEEFQKTSEAAGQVESLTVAFKKFGTISKELADAAGLSATQAGQVQAVDAITASQQRAEQEAFNYIEAVTAISQAWRENAQVGQELAAQLAQTALEASQKALSDVFSRPTSEVAGLNVGLARQQLTTARLTNASDPRLNQLNDALDAINRQISETNKANTLSNRAAQQAVKQQQAAQKAQEKAAQDQLDALKKADLEAQIAAERQLAALQKLIDANNKAASDLQTAFIKSNNDLQQQIDVAIGKGDRSGALSLVDQQRQATKTYEANKKAIQDSTDSLTSQQKAAQEAEAERQRQAQLAEANLQEQQKQNKSTEDLTQSLDDAKAAQDDQTQALNDSKDAIQAQIDAIQKPITASQRQEKVIQDQIAVYEAQTNVLKALGVAADHTLLSQDQQKTAAEHFTAQIEYASGQAKALATSFYDFLPDAKAADDASKLLQGTMDAVKTKIDTVLNPGFDATAEHQHLLDLATQNLATTSDNSATKIGQSAQKLQDEISRTITAEEQILADAQQQFSHIAPSAPSGLASNATNILNSILNRIGIHFAYGGFTGAYGGPAIVHPNEIVLPLSQPDRSAELLTQIPPSITAALAKRNGQAIFAPNISVSGETLDTMEVTAIRAVQRAFRDARTMSGRSGGLITQGLGPGH